KELAEKAGALAGEAARIPAAIDAVIEGIKSKFSIDTLGGEALKSVIDGTNYYDASYITTAIYNKFQVSSCLPSVPFLGGPPVPGAGANKPICSAVDKLYLGSGNFLDKSSLPGSIQKDVAKIVAGAEQAAKAKAAMVASDKTLAVETAKKQ
uniref:Rifin n=1 Tax=Plasmodium falciparum (isolate 3D7) TaxID=36329 RepID=UPI001ABD4886|nr:Chain C, Rifin [Plasmodium falciparum 3D7]7KFK_E Chain E, Rifin [Plasmodium falciparum 3D7]7KHF_C Chain C, Rifin [Plasmodium falciparum 3D7]7KHF_D Chain D, Rifin [Plasmodium falciparum 3D7]